MSRLGNIKNRIIEIIQSIDGTGIYKTTTGTVNVPDQSLSVAKNESGGLSQKAVNYKVGLKQDDGITGAEQWYSQRAYMDNAVFRVVGKGMLTGDESKYYSDAEDKCFDILDDLKYAFAQTYPLNSPNLPGTSIVESISMQFADIVHHADSDDKINAADVILDIGVMFTTSWDDPESPGCI